MSADPGLIDWVEEAAGPLGRFSKRRLFGGAALYLDGVIFAIVFEDELWFKVDGQTEPMFEAAGCERFTYTSKKGRIGSMSYRRAPSDVYDDADAMLHWAGLALQAGERSGKR